MAKKSRKKTLKKTVKKKAGKKAKPARKSKLKPKSKTRRKVKAKPPRIGDRLSNAYHAVVDTVRGTGALRDKLEKPGTSETE